MKQNITRNEINRSVVIDQNTTHLYGSAARSSTRNTAIISSKYIQFSAYNNTEDLKMASQIQILVLGGTGRVGQLVISEALSRQVPVTALVRKENALQPQSYLSTIVGSPLSNASIKEALTYMLSTNPASQIVIVSTLGQTRTSGNPWAATTSPPVFMAESAQAVVDALRSMEVSQRNRISKVVQLSMFGAKESMANLNMLMRLIMAYSNMAQTVEDHNLTHDIIVKNYGVNKSDVDREIQVPFVMVRPAMLKFGAGNNGDVKVHGSDGTGAGFMPSIQARDVAYFLIDTVVNDNWNGRTPVISN